MTSIKKFLNEHRIAFILFAFTLIYEIVIGNRMSFWRVSDHTFSLYTVDYGMGFCTRILPGAVFNFLFRELSYKNVTAFCTAIVLLMFVGVAVLLEKFIRSVDSEYRLLSLFFALLILTGPASFSVFVIALGYFDLYWVGISVAFIVLLSHKKLYFLFVPLFLISVLVHYGAIVCYIPFMAIMILLKTAYAENKKEKTYLLVVFTVSVVLSLCLTLYFFLFGRANLTYSLHDFNRIIVDRGAKVTYVLDYSLYGDVEYAEESNSVLWTSFPENASFVQKIALMLQQRFLTTDYFAERSGTVLEKVSGAVVSVPAVCIPAAVLINILIKKENNFLKRFSCLCSLLLFVGTLIVGLLGSTDTFRWRTNAFLPLFASFLYLLYKEGVPLWEKLRSVFSHFSVTALSMYLVLYMVCVASVM